MPTPLSNYQHVYNGNSMVLRKIQKKKETPTEQGVKPTAIAIAVPTVTKVMPPDAKALRARLTAELMKSL